MLTFEQKLAILESFPQLERKNVSMGRVNFHYEQSVLEKKNVGFHFHPGGNGYIFAGEIDGYETDDKGFVNVRDYSEEELRSLVEQSIQSLTGEEDWTEGKEEKWVDADKVVLTLKFEDDMWYIFSGMNLEAAYETHEEAREYLRDEGFRPQ
jgi:hypothetical protein